MSCSRWIRHRFIAWCFLFVLLLLSIGFSSGGVVPEAGVPGGQPADSGVQDSADTEMNYTLAGPTYEPYRVDGEVRESRVGSNPVVFEGETLWADVNVTNEGDSPGQYTVSVRVAGEVVDSSQGHLDPCEQTDEPVPIGVQFDSPGQASVNFSGHEGDCYCQTGG